MLIEFTFHFFHIEAGLENHFKFQLANFGQVALMFYWATTYWS